MTRPRGYSIELTVYRDAGDSEVDWEALRIEPRERYPRGVPVGPHVGFDSGAEYIGPCRCEPCLVFKRSALAVRAARRAAAQFERHFPEHAAAVRAASEVSVHNQSLLDDVLELELQEREDGERAVDERGD